MTRARIAIGLWMVATILILATEARAMNHCDGSAVCCPTSIANQLTQQVRVSIGVAILGLNNVNERAGTWDADYYLYESWPPTEGFTPQTEVVNEIVRPDGEPVFDNTELRDGRCIRSRRIRSTVSNAFNLRMFPFDHQELVLKFSDSEFNLSSVRYEDTPVVLGLDEQARRQLSAWKSEGEPVFLRSVQAFQWEEHAPQYDYATFSFRVRRHVTFHVAKFFMPLAVIILVAMMVLWINPEDLNTRVTIGVTCLLAAIAFQYAEASNLPEVAYLTLADRVYTCSYAAIAATMMQSIFASMCVQRNQRERALKWDRLARRAMPALLIASVVLSILASASKVTE